MREAFEQVALYLLPYWGVLLYVKYRLCVNPALNPVEAIQLCRVGIFFQNQLELDSKPVFYLYYSLS